MIGIDPKDTSTLPYSDLRDGHAGKGPVAMDCIAAAELGGSTSGYLKGRRIGVVVPSQMGVSSPAAAIAARTAVDALVSAGAVVIDIPHLAQSAGKEAENTARSGESEGHQKLISEGEFALLLHEFGPDLEAYLETRQGPVRNNDEICIKNEELCISK